MSFDAGQFRAEVRAFCREHFPADLARKADAYVHFSKADRVRWQRLLDEHGWFVGHWPVEFGGQGWGPLQRFIFIEELEYAARIHRRLGCPVFDVSELSIEETAQRIMRTVAQRTRDGAER